jgi:transcriptional regulator with XRE-family HTH domain
MESRVITVAQCSVRVTGCLGATCDIVLSVAGIKKSSTQSRALADALAALRADRGLTQRAFAELVDVEQSTWAKYETAKRTPDTDTLTKVFDKLGLDDGQRKEIFATARGMNSARWIATTLPERQAQLAALLRFEAQAIRVFHNATDLIPGVLQTTGYMRAIMESRWAELDPDEVEVRIATRVGRRDIITRRDPAHFVVCLGEAALRQFVGDAQVQIDQLRYLLELAELPNIELHAYRFDSGWHPALDGPFILLESEKDSHIVHVATGPSGVFLHEDDDVAYYRNTVRTLVGDPAAKRESERVAMSSEATVELIADVIKELE